MSRTAFLEVLLDRQPCASGFPQEKKPSLPHLERVTPSSASHCQLQPTPLVQGKWPPHSFACHGRSESRNCPNCPRALTPQGWRAPTHPLQPGDLLAWLTTVLPPAPGPGLQRSLISGTGGRPGPRLSAFTARSTARENSLHGFNGV